jgi:hypothetical protein
MFDSFMMRPTQQNYWFYALAAILGPSQGIFNALIFLQRKRKSLAAMFPRFSAAFKISGKASSGLKAAASCENVQDRMNLQNKNKDAEDRVDEVQDLPAA